MNTPASSAAVRYEFAVLEWLRDDALLRGAAWGALILLAVAAVWWYWRERGSLRWGAVWWLMALRLIALSAVGVMALGPQRRTAEVQTRPSNVVVLVDNSLSMSLRGEGAAEGTPASPTEKSRSAAALDLIDRSPLIARLIKEHQVELRATDGAVTRRLPRVETLPTGAKQADESREAAAPTADWRREFRPVASETRLGNALAGVHDDYAGRPLAGVVLLTDGQNNAGRDPLAVAGALKERGAALHAIGFGPTTPGANVALRELLAPSRAYPEDEIELVATVEATGSTGGVEAQLFRRRESDPASKAELLATRKVMFEPRDTTPAKSDYRQQSLSFKEKPPEFGAYVYSVRLSARANEADKKDNEREVVVEVVDRTLRVLLLAGGPTRDYRFLRGQLRRDDAFEVDVLLQSAPTGVLQDADETLNEFPATNEETNNYDVIVAFDPDWRQLGEAAQERIETAVSEHGVGFLYAPGPVHTPRWLGLRQASPIKKALPVQMPDRWLALSTSGKASRSRSRFVLTSAGDEAEFLWMAGGRSASLEAWREFRGFYRCFPIQAVKPGAVVYARSDAALGGDAALAGATGVMLAEQFYGSGRAMVLASSELWRVRSVDPAYFSTLTTKLLQHLAQGRLAANSPGGSLQFERARYRVGDTIVLRASRVDAPVETPLAAQVVEPGGTVRNVELTPSEARAGEWIVRWTTTVAGPIKAVMQTPRSSSLQARAEIRVPARERSSLVRDETFLAQATTAGGGHYYPTVAAALRGDGDLAALPDLLPSQAETTVVFGQPDPAFAERVSTIALALVASCLIVEWLGRRLHRLA